MIWKYGHCVTECRCNEPFKMINFTTLTPMDNKCIKEDNNIIDKVGTILKSIGFDFWSCSVMLINHQHIEKSDIIKQLNKYDIFSERII